MLASQSRVVREGSVGLLILLTLGLFGVGILWLKGLNPANRSFTVIVDFATISGIQTGSPVRYRGVNVGRVTELKPQPNGVEVKIDIAPANLIIPKDSVISVNQSGLLGETLLDIVPKQPLKPGVAAGQPLDRDCNSQLILCQGSRAQGTIGISADELIRASIRFADVYSSPQFTGNLNTLARNSSNAAAQVTQLSREVTGLVKDTRKELGTFTNTAKSIGNAADQVTLTVGQVNGLVTANRSTLVSTLDNLNVTSRELRQGISHLSPVIAQVERSRIIQNLDQLSTNAAQASMNVRDISAALNNPTNLAILQQTLDSARVTFQNTQKITADLDDLTGDPALRENLRRVINGLGGLVSSTEQLQRQAEVAQILTPRRSPPSAPATPVSQVERPEADRQQSPKYRSRPIKTSPN